MSTHKLDENGERLCAASRRLGVKDTLTVIAMTPTMTLSDEQSPACHLVDPIAIFLTLCDELSVSETVHRSIART